MEFGKAGFWVALAQIIGINIVLSGDNAVVIALFPLIVVVLLVVLNVQSEQARLALSEEQRQTAAERDAWEGEMFGEKGAAKNFDNLRARLVARTIVGPDHKRLFTDADVSALGAKSAAALDRVFGVAQRLNGLGRRDIEALVKN